MQLSCQRLSNGSLPKCADQYPNQRDANLDGGQEMIGLISQLQRTARSSAALAGPALKACFARRDHCNLGHGKHTVDDDEQQDDQDFHIYLYHSTQSASEEKPLDTEAVNCSASARRSSLGRVGAPTMGKGSRSNRLA